MIKQHKLLTRIACWVDAGKIQSTLTESLSPLNTAHLRAAHTKIESVRLIGKFPLTGWPH